MVFFEIYPTGRLAISFSSSLILSSVFGIISPFHRIGAINKA